MIANIYNDIEKLEADLWEAADNLRANSKLTSSDYFMPVLGVIFLRHAANRFEAARRQIQADQVAWLQDRFPKAELEAVPGAGQARGSQGHRGGRLEPHSRPLRRRRPAASSFGSRITRWRTSFSHWSGFS